MEVHIDLQGRRVRVVNHWFKEIKWFIADSIRVFSSFAVRCSFEDEVSEDLVVESNHVRQREQLVGR